MHLRLMKHLDNFVCFNYTLLLQLYVIYDVFTYVKLPIIREKYYHKQNFTCQ